jgi:glycosyltransferase involved in cell wall biosynthesis
MTKQNLILIAPLPPPYGGISIIAKSLIAAGLKDNFNLAHLNTFKNRSTEDFGQITMHDVFLTLKYYLKLYLMCMNNPKVRYAFLIGTSDTGIVRDLGYILIMKLFKIEILFNLHGTRNINNKNWIIRMLTKCAIKKSKYILSPTQIDKEEACQLSEDMSKVKLFYNSNFINEGSLKNIMKKKSNTFHIIGIGRLSIAKGAFDLIEVCIDLIKNGNDIRLTWVGKGAYEEDNLKAKELIENNTEIQKRINIQANISDEEKYSLLCDSDIFILPSYSDNLPIAILEAMAFGLPVISTIVGAIPEVIENDINGWLLDPGDKNKLKEKIISAYQNQSILHEIGKMNQRKFDKTFNSNKRILELKSLI